MTHVRIFGSVSTPLSIDQRVLKRIIISVDKESLKDKNQRLSKSKFLGLWLSRSFPVLRRKRKGGKMSNIFIAIRCIIVATSANRRESREHPLQIGRLEIDSYGLLKACELQSPKASFETRKALLESRRITEDQLRSRL